MVRTARLVLSVPTGRDVEAIHAACQDADIQRFTMVPSPYLREHAEGFIAVAAAGWDSGAEATWAIRADGELAGMISLNHLPGGGPEIGYWIARRSRRRGFATEACRAVIDWGFAPERPAVARVEWRAVVGNLGSARVAQALGFRHEGMLRLALRNSLGRSDAWVAGLLRDDDRTPTPWSVLGD